MEDVLFVILCIALPVSIVWMVQRSRQNETNKKAEIMLKAIEAGVPVDLSSTGNGILNDIRAFLEPWKKYLPIPVALTAITLGLVLSSGERRAERF